MPFESLELKHPPKTMNRFKKTIHLLMVALFLLPLAAAADYETAIDAYLKGDYKTALHEFKVIAKQGDPKALFHLGNMYENGKGVPKSLTKAAKWYLKSAEKGYANAQYNLGVSYYNGEGVKKSYKNAVKWWRKAAQQGVDDAQLNLGIAYAKGEGVKQDLVKSYMWANIASTYGNVESKKFIEHIVYSITLKQMNDGEKLSNDWLDKYE